MARKQATVSVSRELSGLPLDIVTETMAIIAIRGAGKTHTASVFNEEFLKAGQVTVAYDPTGAWWGLKSSCDGKKPGFPVVVFGGEHADVPLIESSGETIARVIVERRIPSILDVSLLRKAARTRFMTSFLESLHHLNRDPLHLFIDEAHTIAPQRPSPDSMQLLGAIEDVVLQGRRRGLGCTLISQRPALVNKNVLTQCSTLVAMRLASRLDIGVVRDWVEVHADPGQADKMIASLPTLKNGEAWVWSPSALEVFTRTKFRDRETFDSSATPKAGRRVITPKTFAKIDVAKLGSEIQSAIDQAKANDPKELKRRIAELEAGERKHKQYNESINHTQYHNERLAFESKIATLNKALRVKDRLYNQLVEKVQKFANSFALVEFDDDEPVRQKPFTSTDVGKPVIVRALKTPPGERASAGDSNLGKAERAILCAAYWTDGESPSRSKLAFYSNYSNKSSGLDKALSTLRTKGMLEGLNITASGRQVAESLGVDTKPTGSQLREWFRSKIGAAANAVLDVLIEAYPDRLMRDEIAKRSNYSDRSSGLDKAMSLLRSLEAASGGDRDGGMKASDVFFE